LLLLLLLVVVERVRTWLLSVIVVVVVVVVVVVRAENFSCSCFFLLFGYWVCPPQQSSQPIRKANNNTHNKIQNPKNGALDQDQEDIYDISYDMAHMFGNKQTKIIIIP
jgi:hypothetical protein